MSGKRGPGSRRSDTKRRKDGNDDDNSKCSDCGLKYSSTLLQYHVDDPEGSLDEFQIITDTKLLSVYENSGLDVMAEVPQYKLTNYSVYDSEKHLIEIDSNLIENDKMVYFSGYVKPIFDDDPSVNNGLIAASIGPIIEWWVAGFDGGKEPLVGLETEYASYVLMRPSKEYKKFFDRLLNKIFPTKYAIEFLTSNPDANFEDLLEFLRDKIKTDYPEEIMLKHANFIVSQIISYDEAAEDGDVLVLETQCIQDFVAFCGIKEPIKSKKNKTKRTNEKRFVRIDRRRPLKNSDTFCTTTPLVKNFFETVFKDAMESSTGPNSVKKSRRECSNSSEVTINWSGVPRFVDEKTRYSYYHSVKIGSNSYSCGNFVTIKCKNEQLNDIGRIIKLFETSNRKKMCHIHWFRKGKKTILKELSHPLLLFMTYDCDDILINTIEKKVDVEISETINSPTTKMLCNKLYIAATGRFEDLPRKTFDCFSNCLTCEFKKEEISRNSLKKGQIIKTFQDKLEYLNFYLDNCLYSVGDCILISTSETNFQENLNDNSDDTEKQNSYDDTIFSERYRKTFSKNFLFDNLPAAKVAIISKIYSNNSDISELNLIVKKFYRPHEVFKEQEDIVKSDLNLLFLTDELMTINAKLCVSKCIVKFNSEIENNYAFGFPQEFYFQKKLVVETGELTEPTPKDIEQFKTDHNLPKTFQKLQALDVFAGCGGLAFGFESAGVVETKWAIEKDDIACKSFKGNFPQTILFEEDANFVLKNILDNKLNSENGLPLPVKGEVDIIIAGPPCQGFSGMNRFSSRQYSLFKNSLIVTLLSYVDHYRPKYFILENVRNFLTFKKCMILKLTIACLVRMGYQVCFGMLQAGCYGVPQARRRAVIMASSPGNALPQLPQPTHSFSQRLCQLSFRVDDLMYESTIELNKIYFRAITVQDAISDLPVLDDNGSKFSHYLCDPITHYQKCLRKEMDGKLEDHTCKVVNPLTEARIKHIPKGHGSDWRDLPNISVQLSDRSFTNKLIYNHHDIENGKSSDGNLRGVCTCASGKPCQRDSCHQDNTLIPWCLVHTANRSYHWVGLYGRLQWNGFFSTTVTNPEPISKQGRVLHPEQNRIISVREAARSQSFPDHFKFYGNEMAKYRQIGNAVPPLLALAIANEFKRILR